MMATIECRSPDIVDAPAFVQIAPATGHRHLA